MYTFSVAANTSFSTTIDALGSTFSFRQLVAYIEETRGKPIRLAREFLPVGITGACFALADCDLIWTRTHLDRLRTRFAALHELAHLMLGHVPSSTAGNATPTYVQFRGRYLTVRAEQVRYRTPHTYMNTDEYDAELLATKFFAQLSQPSATKTTKATSLVENKWLNETRLLHYLHKRLMQIAPDVRLPTLPTARFEIEIADAREYILSQLSTRLPPTAPCTTKVSRLLSSQQRAAYNEAYYIHTLLQLGHSFHAIGSWMPQLPVTNVRHYNIRVAHYLEHLEHTQ